MNMHKKRNLEPRYIVILILVTITIILGSLLYVFNNNRTLTIIEKTIKDTGLFIQDIIYTPIRWIDDKLEETKERKKINEEYKKLKKKEKEYDALKAKYSELNKELNEMTDLLELNSTMQEGTYVNATTITRNIDYWYHNITIDKGEKNQIQKGNSVINGKGLIGYIETTSNSYSTVKLLTAENLNHKISVKIEVGELLIYGLLTYYNRDKNIFTIEGISENTGIPKGSLVTTTGLGNSFPPGLIIGYVESTVMDNFELAKTVNVKPAVNFEDISYVTVINKESTE